MPIDQPPAIVEPVKPEPTGQQQWTTLMDALMREQAVARKYRTDVMNFLGAATNAKTGAEAAEVRVASLQEMMKMLHAKLISQGLKFIDDEWQ